MRCLNIVVSPVLVARWVRWFAPPVQPFLLGPTGRAGIRAGAVTGAWLSMELQDTFGIYGAAVGDVTGFDEAAFMALPRAARRSLIRAQVAHARELVPSVRAWSAVVGDAATAQGDTHRFLWWPSLLAGVEELVLAEYVQDGVLPDRHEEVGEATWAAAAVVLPHVRRLAGTFAGSSGPNCFGTVMAAAGVPGAEEVWMQREPFEQWLSSAAARGGNDDESGTVLVWRSADSLVQHAAVTIGDGWALHKPSQGWMSPRQVLPVPDIKRAARTAGRRLQRYTLYRPPHPG